MSEQPEQPTKEKFEATMEVLKFIAGDTPRAPFNCRMVEEVCVKLYPRKSCATCDLCLLPTGKRGSTDLSICFKFAAIVIFDKNENPSCSAWRLRLAPAPEDGRERRALEAVRKEFVVRKSGFAWVNSVERVLALIDEALAEKEGEKP